MEIEYENKYHEVEKHNWWFVSRRLYLLDLIKNASRDSKILDIGCSSGIFLKDLEQLGFKTENLFGVDISEKAIANCKKNGIQNSFVMDAQNISLTEKFDIIIASDCLEHLENDTMAIQNWKQLLKNNGFLYVFVPAFQSLWSEHDEVNQHFRRYTKNELITKLLDAKFVILKSSYWNFFLFLPVYLYRKLTNFLPKNQKNEGQIVGNKLVNLFLLNLVIFENKLLKFINFPFGVSTFCIVKKEDN
jgi:SAM-dependent methyltransferase